MIRQLGVGESGGAPPLVVDRSVGSQSPLAIGSPESSEASSDYRPPR